MDKNENARRNNNQNDLGEERGLMKQATDRARESWMNMSPEEREKLMPGEKSGPDPAMAQRCGHEKDPAQDPKCREYVEENREEFQSRSRQSRNLE